MSIYLPGNHDWLANGWISRAFFRDAAAAAPGVTGLASEIAGLAESDAKTLDLEDRPPEVIREFDGIVEAVIAYNRRLAGSNFGQPEFFPIYSDHLAKLKQTVEDSLSGQPASPSRQT